MVSYFFNHIHFFLAVIYSPRVSDYYMHIHIHTHTFMLHQQVSNVEQATACQRRKKSPRASESQMSWQVCARGEGRGGGRDFIYKDKLPCSCVADNFLLQWFLTTNKINFWVLSSYTCIPCASFSIIRHALYFACHSLFFSLFSSRFLSIFLSAPHVCAKHLLLSPLPFARLE